MSQIVLARVNEESVVVKEGRRDIGEQHQFALVDKPVAMMWVRDGNAEDRVKAEAFAKEEGYTVFAYDSSERDPLERAKRDVLAIKAASQPKPPKPKTPRPRRHR